MAKKPVVQTDEQQSIKHVHSNCLKIKIEHLKTLYPLSDNQKLFFDMYNQGETLYALLGSAGTGKTTLSIYKALCEVLDKGNPYSKVIIVRSAVPTREIGHLPGSVEEKMEIYELPYVQICHSLFARQDAYTRLKEQKYIEFIPTSYVRGMTFDNCIVIFEEIQNCTYAEQFSVITRIGMNSKLIMCGDIRQTDLNKKKNDISGLTTFLEICKRIPYYNEINFTTADIVRSGLVRDFIVSAEEYENEGNYIPVSI